MVGQFGATTSGRMTFGGVAFGRITLSKGAHSRQNVAGLTSVSLLNVIRLAVILPNVVAPESLPLTYGRS
jgi:hypothetical protein